MGVAETTYFLSQCVIRGTDRQLIMSLFLDCSPLQQRCTVTGRKPCCVWRRLPYRRLVRALFDRLQYEGGGRGVTLLEQDLVEPLQLGLICKTTEQDNTLQWGCKCAVKGSVRFIYVCVCLLSVDWTDAFDCFNVRPILVLSRLTCGMEINDDLHVNGPPSCISQGRGGEEEWSGSFVCVYTEHFTFYIILPLKRTGLLQKLRHTHTHTHPRPGQSRSCNTTATGRALLSFGMI